MKRGKRYNEEIDKMIINILLKHKHGYIEFIRREIEKGYKILLSWNTIRNHLSVMINKGSVEEIVLSDKKRRISIFKPLL